MRKERMKEGKKKKKAKSIKFINKKRGKNLL